MPLPGVAAAASLKLVVVEDHDSLREVTVAILNEAGHHATGLASAEALDVAAGGRLADIYLIDINLPGEDGISLVARIRAAQPDIGIIMVTARNQVRDKVVGFNSGADIYLTKPTSADELIAAVRALTRRIKPDAPGTCDFTLHMAALTLQGPQGKASLSTHETATLAAFVRAKDQQLETWQLIELADKQVNDASKKALEVQIVRLRKKLQQCGAQEPTFKAIRGQGYHLCIKVALSTD